MGIRSYHVRGYVLVLLLSLVSLALPLLASAAERGERSRDMREITRDAREFPERDMTAPNPPEPEEIEPRIDGRLEELMEAVCDRVDMMLEREVEISVPDFCVPPPPPPAEGEMIISEIMYNPDGSDTDREWIELWNGRSTPVNLSAWTLSENDTDHPLTLMSGDAIIPPGGFAIIARDQAGFLTDWPGFTGTLLEAVFTLVNTGETIGIKNGAGTLIDEVSYTPDLGGNDDGTSLQKIGTDWVGALPTPGAENSADTL